MEYLGVNYWRPPMPRSYAFVMTAVTVPVVTLAAFGVGVVVTVRRDFARAWRRFRRATEQRSTPSPFEMRVDPGTTLLWLLAMAVQYAAWLSPTTPIFGGTKHWMTAYPFLVLFAAEGVRAALLDMRHRWPRTGLRPLLGGPGIELLTVACVLLPPAVQAVHAHPWALSSYNVLVGGAAGGATLGLNRGFWGYTTGAIAEQINRAAEPRASIYIHDTARASWDMLVRDARVRGDLRPSWDVGEASIALHHHEMHMNGEDYQAWIAFGTAAPTHVAGLDGVPVVWLYQRPLGRSGDAWP
jgi:hypothetical protein